MAVGLSKTRVFHFLRNYLIAIKNYKCTLSEKMRFEQTELKMTYFNDIKMLKNATMSRSRVKQRRAKYRTSNILVINYKLTFTDINY